MITKTYAFCNLINNRELFQLVQPMYALFAIKEKESSPTVNFYKFIKKR